MLKLVLEQYTSTLSEILTEEQRREHRELLSAIQAETAELREGIEAYNPEAARVIANAAMELHRLFKAHVSAPLGALSATLERAEEWHDAVGDDVAKELDGDVGEIDAFLQRWDECAPSPDLEDASDVPRIIDRAFDSAVIIDIDHIDTGCVGFDSITST